MSDRQTIGVKIMAAFVTFMVLAASGYVWKKSGLVKPQTIVTRADAAGTPMTISPFEIMVQHGKNLPVENWTDPF
jgi:hypothetical protein